MSGCQKTKPSWSLPRAPFELGSRVWRRHNQTSQISHISHEPQNYYLLSHLTFQSWTCCPCQFTRPSFSVLPVGEIAEYLSSAPWHVLKFSWVIPPSQASHPEAEGHGTTPALQLVIGNIWKYDLFRDPQKIQAEKWPSKLCPQTIPPKKSLLKLEAALKLLQSLQ